MVLLRESLTRPLKQLSGTSANGLDEIPLLLLKQMRKETGEHLRDALDYFVQSSNMPRKWRYARIRIILKKGVDKSLPDSYRPITITSAMYRLFANIVQARLHRWAKAEVLKELQNSFQPGGYLTDNIFVVTQAIEVALKEFRPIFLAFMDISQAYNAIEQATLWSTLSQLGAVEEVVTLLKSLYTDTQTVVQWGQKN
ncbi:hypothetical protein MRX96_029891 [Rhipicephalus microplus]